MTIQGIIKKVGTKKVLFFAFIFILIISLSNNPRNKPKFASSNIQTISNLATSIEYLNSNNIWTNVHVSRVQGQISINNMKILNHKNVKVRIKFKKSSLTTPCIYIEHIEATALRAYLNKKIIFNTSSKSDDFLENTLITIGTNISGKYLYLELSGVNNPGINEIANFNIGNQKDVLKYMIRTNFPDILLGFFFTLFGILIFPISFAFPKGQRKTLLPLGFFVLCFGLSTVSTYKNINLLLFSSDSWSLILIISKFFMPFFFIKFFSQFFNPEENLKAQKFMKIQIKIQSVVFMIFLTFVSVFSLEIPLTLKAFILLISQCLYLIDALFVVFSISKKDLKFNLENLIFILGTLIFTILSLFERTSKGGMLIFLICLLGILIHRFTRINNSLGYLNKNLEATVSERTIAIRTILDSVGEGFLTFDETLIIQDDYSCECEKIFKKENLSGTKFNELLFQDDMEQQKFFTAVFESIFKEPEKSSLYVSLLPDELTINDRIISVKYKILRPINKNSTIVMTILTDVTQQKELQIKMEQERKLLNMVVKVISNKHEFLDAINDYNNFCEFDIHEILESKIKLDLMSAEIFRNIHTFKGTFSQFDMLHSVEKLHDFESLISDFRANLDNHTFDELKNFILNTPINNYLNDDINVLKIYLGDDFFESKNVITVEKNKLLEIERKVVSILSPEECNILLPYLKKLMYVQFYDLLKSYTYYTEKLSERLEKPINPLIIDCNEILVDNEIYHNFAKSLVHIFRNCIDHGIETLDERIEKDKSELGTIQCCVKKIKNNIIVSISDDGAGIDIEMLKQKALEKGLKIPDNPFDILFKDEFSTKSHINSISGRGIGLSAVKMEVEKLNGTIEVKSTKDVGTEFIFTLPLEEATVLHKISCENIMPPLIETTKSYLLKNNQIAISSIEKIAMAKNDKIHLNKISTFINVKGIINGRFIFSIEEDFLKVIMKDFVLDELTDEEEHEYMQDTMSELTNIILGNSIKNFVGLDDLITIEFPTIICYEGASIKYPSAEIWAYDLHSEFGILRLSFVLSNLLQ